jgi:type III secretion protein Q
MTVVALASPIPGQSHSRFVDGAVQRVTRYEPRPLAPDRVKALNRLCRLREPLATTVEGLAVALRTDPVLFGDSGQAALFVGRPALDLVWALGDRERVSLTIPQAVVERLLAALDPGLRQWPREPARSLLIELALSPFLDRLEHHLGPLELIAAEPTKAHELEPPETWAIGFRGALDGAPFGAVLQASGAGDPRGGALDRIARAVEARPVARTPAHALDLPIPLEFQAGTVRLHLRALADLRTGDILVSDDWPFARGEVQVVAGRRLVARAHFLPSGLSLTDRLRPVRTAPMAFSMAHERDLGAPDESDGDGTLDDLEVTLVFEIGRRLIDVAELRSIAPGYVFPMIHDASAPVDILANGRRIGRGEIVRIGETLGVRVARLFGHE